MMELILHLVSDDEKKITNILGISSEKYSNIDSIDIKRISQTPEDLLYRGVLKVSFL